MNQLAIGGGKPSVNVGAIHAGKFVNDGPDISEMELPEDEPLSTEVIEGYQKLAWNVVKMALTDLLDEDEIIQRTAQRFCIGSSKADRATRRAWLGWIGVHEDTLARAARARLQLGNAKGGLRGGIAASS